MRFQNYALSTVLILWFAPTAMAQVVENYSGTGTGDFTLPGSPDGGGGLDFATQLFPTSLDFAPGAVTFMGMPVDFDGTEAQFLASSYNGTYNIPVTSGPATVTGTYDFTATGLAWTGIVDWDATDPGLQLGPGFSASNLDIVNGQAINDTSTTNNWQSPLIPELNGMQVQVNSTGTVVAVDPISGTADAACNGDIAAGPGPVPSLPTWGLALLVIGLGGTAGVLLGRRRAAAV